MRKKPPSMRAVCIAFAKGFAGASRLQRPAFAVIALDELGSLGAIG
jgi:hypothetical protein